MITGNKLIADYNGARDAGLMYIKVVCG